MGKLRQPRVYIDTGFGIATPLECSLHVSAHQTADTFSAELALDDVSDLDESFWLNEAPIDVTISATNDVASDAFTELFIGQVDDAKVYFSQRTVSIKGRDLTAKMIDAKTNKKWLNLDHKDIINEIAKSHGLNVQFAGSAGKSGLQFKDDTNRISDSDSEFNIVVKIAKSMGCIAFVKMRTLYIHPVDQEIGEVYPVYYARPGLFPARASVKTLTCSHNKLLAKDISVSIKGWQHKQGKAITSKVEAKGAKNKSSGSDTSVYQFRSANPTKDQQDKLAKSRLKEITSHERSCEFDLPGDITLDPTMRINLTGTGTDADQVYIISDITHKFSFDGGYHMSVNGRNVDDSRGESTETSVDNSAS